MKASLLAVALLLAATGARADEPQKFPIALELAFDAAEFADMSTTLDIKNHPGMYEQNPLLGQHPSDARIIGSCTVAAGIHALITREMVIHGWNPKVVATWEVLSIGVEGGMAAHNFHIGLRFKL